MNPTTKTYLQLKYNPKVVGTSTFALQIDCKDFPSNVADYFLFVRSIQYPKVVNFQRIRLGEEDMDVLDRFFKILERIDKGEHSTS